MLPLNFVLEVGSPSETNYHWASGWVCRTKAIRIKYALPQAVKMKEFQKTRKPMQSSFAPVRSGILQRTIAEKAQAAKVPPVLYEALNLPISSANQPQIALPKVMISQLRNKYKQESSDNDFWKASSESETAVPNNLKSGIEARSGLSVADVKVHYNSSKPAEIQASAYTQGTNIYLEKGQEKHLPHEVWHVVQQKKGQVKPTSYVRGMPINDVTALEQEADLQGNLALQQSHLDQNGNTKTQPAKVFQPQEPVIQRKYVLAEDRSSAIEKLKETYPAVKESNLQTKVTEKGEDFWETHLNSKTYDELISAILASRLTSTEDKNLPISVALREEEIEGNSSTALRLFITVNPKFSLNQLFKDVNGKLEVYIETVVGDKKVFREGLLPLFKDVGVNKIELAASGIGGSQEGIFAWARYGFIPAKGDWDKMRSFAKNYMNDEKFDEFRHTNTDLNKEILDIISDPSPRAIRNFVHLSWEHRSVKSIKDILDGMLSHVSSWHGSLDLTNENDQQWISNYVSGADLSQYSELLTDIHPHQEVAVGRSKCKCFITTACVQSRGLPDDCEELTVLRNFRDSYLLHTTNGAQLIDLYYRYSPRIVAAIAKQKNASLIYDHLYQVIRKCVEAIKREDNEFAYLTYCEMVIELQKKYLPEASLPSSLF